MKRIKIFCMMSWIVCSIQVNASATPVTNIAFVRYQTTTGGPTITASSNTVSIDVIGSNSPTPTSTATPSINPTVAPAPTWIKEGAPTPLPTASPIHPVFQRDRLRWIESDESQSSTLLETNGVVTNEVALLSDSQILIPKTLTSVSSRSLSNSILYLNRQGSSNVLVGQKSSRYSVVNRYQASHVSSCGSYVWLSSRSTAVAISTSKLTSARKVRSLSSTRFKPSLTTCGYLPNTLMAISGTIGRSSRLHIFFPSGAKKTLDLPLTGLTSINASNGAVALSNGKNVMIFNTTTRKIVSSVRTSKGMRILDFNGEIALLESNTRDLYVYKVKALRLIQVKGEGKKSIRQSTFGPFLIKKMRLRS